MPDHIHGIVSIIDTMIIDPVPRKTGEGTSPLHTNLTADIVRDAARRMRTLRPSATSGTGPSGLEKGGMEVPLLKGDLGGSFTWQPDPSLGSGVYLVRATFPQQTASAACTKRIVYLK